MSRMNYHHLYYFWAVAKDGNLTRTAETLHVSQSALSTQIKPLEDQLGQALFTRAGRALKLTEAGGVALTDADTIFETGNEVTALLRDGKRLERQVLRIGGVATLSRNFQGNFVKPLLKRTDVELVLQSGSLDELLTRLTVHNLDVVLSNRKVHASSRHPWRCRRIARQPVSLVGKPRGKGKAFCFPEELAELPLLLPGRDSEIRAGFDVLCEQLGLRYQLLAEEDDMAMLRLLAPDSGNTALLPSVVVQDELRSGKPQEYCVVPQLHENFLALTVQRQFEPPLLKTLLRRSEAEVLGTK